MVFVSLVGVLKGAALLENLRLCALWEQEMQDCVRAITETTGKDDDSPASEREGTGWTFV